MLLRSSEEKSHEIKKGKKNQEEAKRSKKM